MKTYCKQKTNKSVNWHEILESKLKNNPCGYSQQQLEQWSNSWVTCACGNMCSVLPRDCTGEPEDVELVELGLDFDDNIRKQNWKAAIKTLNKIEKRSSKLIQEIEKEAIKVLKTTGYLK